MFRLLRASCSQLLPASRTFFAVSFQPVVPVQNFQELLDKHHDTLEKLLQAAQQARKQEADLETLRESLRRARANSEALARAHDLRGLVEITAKCTVVDDPMFKDYLKKHHNKVPGVQECLRLIYDQSSSDKKSLKLHVREMCKTYHLLEATIADILRTKLYHTLSGSHHGASSNPRVIHEGGEHGFSPNEAAALSAFLDFNGVHYEYVVNDTKKEPPPFRIQVDLAEIATAATEDT